MQVDFLEWYGQTIAKLADKNRIECKDFEQQLGALVRDQNCVTYLAARRD